MLDRLFYGSVLVVLIGVIAGQSYRYGLARGELQALKARQQAATAEEGPRAGEAPSPSLAATPVAPERTTRSRVTQEALSTVDRGYLLQAADEARRARQATEETEALAASLRYGQRLAQEQEDRLARERRRLDEERRRLERHREDERSRDRLATTPYAALPDSLDLLAAERVSRSSRRHEKRVVVEHVKTVHVNPCPPGEKLIAATCLPADSIILGQAPIPVRIVNDPIFERPLFKPQRSQEGESGKRVESGPMLPSLWQMQQPWYDGTVSPILPSVWQLQQSAAPRR